MASNIEVFLCYAHEDELLCNELARHLGVLKRQGFFEIWNNREIIAGTEWEREVDRHLNSAQIIILLISQYFMDSDYCYLVEMQRAIERHNRGEARVIPVILRPVFFQRAPFAKLTTLPMNRKPITDPGWYSLDEAFFDVAEGIRKAVEELTVALSVNTPAIHNSSHSELPSQYVKTATLVTSLSQQFYTGDKVRHHVFGEGIILRSTMEQGNEFVDVQFQGQYGKKRLSTDFAKLERLR